MKSRHHEPKKHVNCLATSTSVLYVNSSVLESLSTIFKHQRFYGLFPSMAIILAYFSFWLISVLGLFPSMAYFPPWLISLHGSFPSMAYFPLWLISLHGLFPSPSMAYFPLWLISLLGLFPSKTYFPPWHFSLIYHDLVW